MTFQLTPPQHQRACTDSTVDTSCTDGGATTGGGGVDATAWTSGPEKRIIGSRGHGVLTAIPSVNQEDPLPTYEYACTVCHQSLEAVQSFTDEALTECPHCGGRLRKVFPAVGVVFKGSGFYRNDSRASNGSKQPAKESPASTKTTSKDSAKKDSSPSSSQDAPTSRQPASESKTTSSAA